MMKFDEFKSKDKGIKKQEKELKKKKMKNNIDRLTKKKREIQTKMNQFVNSPSYYEMLKIPAFTH
ncbi:MAG TPA: hypothetical protein DCR40_00920 [Prolixibacteraceae bacterium]|nr:hypothetical protein [Prolixibacteraceae bacterium]